MRKRQKSILVLAIITAFITMGLFLPGLIRAGDLEPSDPPGPTMHRADEIYDKLDEIVPGGGVAPVEKTGQTISYATGDDRDLEKGVNWPIPRFTDNDDGTVTDNLTGLIWLKNANCFGTRTWADALTDCNDLADGECGLTDGSSPGDWRLPNAKEIFSLFHRAFYGPALPNTAGTGQWAEGDPFSGVQSSAMYSEYWVANTLSVQTGSAYRVSLSSGYVVGTSAKTMAFSMYVWPVRGGQ